MIELKEKVTGEGCLKTALEVTAIGGGISWQQQLNMFVGYLLLVDFTDGYILLRFSRIPIVCFGSFHTDTSVG